MTKKALRGGKSSFDEKGAFAANVCGALRKITHQYDQVVSRIASTTEDRDAWQKEFAEEKKGSTRHQELGVKYSQAVLDLKKLRSQKQSLGAAYGRVVRKADANEIDPEMTVDQILDDATAEQEGDDDEEEDQTPQMRLLGTHNVKATDGWRDQYKACPQAFEGREWPLVHDQISKLLSVSKEIWGRAALMSPLELALAIPTAFARSATTKSRKGIFPPMTDWALAGVAELMDRHARMELGAKGDAEAESNASRIEAALRDAADKDPDAFVHLFGKDSRVNRLVSAG